MRTQMLTAASLAALLAAVPAFAQSSDPAAEPDTGTTMEQETLPGAQSGTESGAQPGTGTQSDTGSMSATPPATDSGTGTDTTDSDMAQDTPPAADAPAAGMGSDDMYIVSQTDGEILASELIGAKVENGEGETIGEINDVIVTETEGVKGVVIGVGGFLGMGEKDVGVSFDQIDQTRDENGDVQLMLMASADELKQAEDFMTLSDKMAEEQAARAATQAPATGTTGTTTPPAPQ